MSPARRAASHARFAVLALPCAWLWACATTVHPDAGDAQRRPSAATPSTPTPGSPGSTVTPSESSVDERSLSLALARIGLSSAAPDERRALERIRPAVAAPGEGSALESRMRTMLATSFSVDERRLALAQGELRLAFDLLREGSLADAKLLARFILSKEGLSPQLHRWALSAWMIAHALEIESRGAPLPVDFNELQRAHCEDLCALPGWRLVSVEDGGSLSQDGYFNRLLTRLQFELAGVTRPEWLTRLLEAARPPVGPPAPSTATAFDGMPPLAALSRLVAQKRWADAVPLGTRALAEREEFLARKGTRSAATAPSGPCDGLRTLTAYASANLARSTQRRDEFFARQEELVAELEKPRCEARDLALDEEEFGAFVTDARLWYARLLWESGRLPEAEKWSSRALAAAARAGEWDLYLEAAQVLVGRVEFERREPATLVSLIDEVVARYGGPEGDAFATWALLRKGLSLLAAGNGASAEETFVALARIVPGGAGRAQAAYWIGRSRRAQGREGEAREAFENAGREDPLGYYDLLAGRALGRISGFASTLSGTPFDDPWREVQERWIRMRVGRPFVLFRPELWFGDDTGTDEEEAVTDSQALAAAAAAAAHRKAFEDGVASSLLLATALRAGAGFDSFERYSAYLRESGSFYSRLLRSEALWLQQTYVASYGAGRRHLPSAVRIAWLLHAIGDPKNAIPFVALFKEDLLRQEEDLAFLYFIFFPKPYGPAFQDAARACRVDAYLLYAVARQESLFQPGAVSGAGAVGLMQLLPATATRVLAAREKASALKPVSREALTDPALNTLAGACYLRELLDRYKGDVGTAVAAYNAGENVVDTWLRTRAKGGDPDAFVEWIPFQETRDYVQKVLRNHANFRWIYGEAD